MPGFFFVLCNIIQSKSTLLGIIYYDTVQDWNLVIKNMNLEQSKCKILSYLEARLV